MLKNMQMDEFFTELASDSPAPGGGSVACVCGSMAAALAAMVSRLTIGKEKYRQVEALFKEKLSILDELQLKLVNLIDKDANAFNGVIAAFKMPKESEKEKKIRTQKIQEEYKKAASVPMETVEISKKVLDIILEIGLKGNKNALSDIAVAALNASTAIKSAALNVEINLPAIKDDAFKKEMQKKLDTILEDLDMDVKNLVEEARKSF